MALLALQFRCAWRARFAGLCLLIGLAQPGMAADGVMSGNEKALKVAFLYNFALFTEWPPAVGSTLNLCILGTEPFGKELEELQGKAVGARSLALQRKASGAPLKGCHVLFVSAQAIGDLARVLEEVRASPVLTVADSPGAARQGVALNMVVVQNRITFEANLLAARSAGLGLSSKLLRVATEVIQ